MKLSAFARPLAAAVALSATVLFGGAPPERVAAAPAAFTTQIGVLNCSFARIEGNFRTGDFTIPGEIKCTGKDGDSRSDRGFLNSKRVEVTLIGHVVVHRLGGVGRPGQPQEPVTLTCDVLKIETNAKMYTASGNVKVVQGVKTLTAPYMHLDDNTHVGTLTGGVHAEELPNRAFDADEVVYNTLSEDFKATGGVRLMFPASGPQAPTSGAATPSPAPTKKP